jgi:hypothetical protein
MRRVTRRGFKESENVLYLHKKTYIIKKYSLSKIEYLRNPIIEERQRVLIKQILIQKNKSEFTKEELLQMYLTDLIRSPHFVKTITTSNLFPQYLRFKEDEKKYIIKDSTNIRKE